MAADVARESNFQWWVRFGFVTRGLLYVVIAWLVIATGRTEDLTGAMEYLGHGIGTKMHMEPFLPNFGKPGKGPRLKVGMAIAIEPMLTLGTDDSQELEDGWTVITLDGTRAAHWEHSVAITEDGPWVLTAPEED